jgi:hypothetical protein
MQPEELPDDREVEELLSQLDHPVPPVSAEMVIRRARRTGAVRLRRAAAIALGLGVLASAAYASPGSPIPGWIERAGRALGLGREDTGPAAPVPPPVESAGIVLVPGDSLVVEFLEPGLAGYLRVDLTDEPTVTVRAPTGSTRFVSEPRRLLVEHPTPDTVLVRLPRTGGRVSIRAGGRELFLRDGAQVRAAQEAGIDGAFVFPLAGGGA